MSVEEIKRCLALLSPSEQNEIAAYLFHLRHLADPDYHRQIQGRLAGRAPGQWLDLDEFEQRLDGR